MLDKLTAKFGTDRPTEAQSRAFGRPVVRIPVTLIASLLAFLVAAILLGAYVPAIPKAGVIGPVLGGEYPFHKALFALIGIALAVPARRSGLVRRCPAVTVVTALSAIAALVIAGVQFAAAQKKGTGRLLRFGRRRGLPQPVRASVIQPTGTSPPGSLSVENSMIAAARACSTSGVRPHQRHTPTAGP